MKSLYDECFSEQFPEVYPGTYAPCRSPNIDVSGQLIPSWLVLIIVIIIVFILLYLEYKAHDCIPGKECNHQVPKPTSEDNNLDYINKIMNMVKNNYDYVTWRQSLLVALIVPLFVIFYLKGRLPTLLEWLIVGILVFLGVYLSYSWIWAHFFYPNGQAIEDCLQKLHDRVKN